MESTIREIGHKQVIRAVYISKTGAGRYILRFDAEDETDIALAKIATCFTDLPSMRAEYDDHADAVSAALAYLSLLGCPDTLPHDNFD